MNDGLGSFDPAFGSSNVHRNPAPLFSSLGAVPSGVAAGVATRQPESRAKSKVLRGQTLDSQLEQLRAAGCGSRNIYREKVTGARADRRELNRMLGKLIPDDVVTVTRIDRLARSTFDLFGIVKRIVEAKAQFRSLAEPWADTGTSTGRLTGC
jgi:hypothetical protein